MNALALLAATAILSLPHTEQGRMELRALFERAPGVLGPETENHSVTMNVLVARIGEDGKVITSCADDETSVERFLTTDIDKLDGAKQSREQ